MLLGSCALFGSETVVVPPLPQVPEYWSADPLRGGDVIQDLGPDVRALPDVVLDGVRVRMVLRRDDGLWQAQLEHTDGVAQRVPVQALFRRLVIGPVGPGRLGLPESEDGTSAHHWLLIKDGRVMVDTHLGRPRFFEDEFDFDIAFHDLRATAWSPEQRGAWREAFWQRERALLRRHLAIDDEDDEDDERAVDDASDE